MTDSAHNLAALNHAAVTVQLIAPVYNEGDNVRILYSKLIDEQVPFDSLTFVYDFPEDTTLPVISKLESADIRVRAEMNRYGRGVINALRWGFSHCKPGPVVVIMADNSDKTEIIPQMVALWNKGATIVAPSRYMPGGVQNGGGFIKSSLSRIAGRSLKLLGFPIADPTNNFKLYDGEWLSKQKIESSGGFEVALELCAKAFYQGRKLAELPTVWTDRFIGTSRFRLTAWLPKYLRWYLPLVGRLFIRNFFVSNEVSRR